MLIRFCFVVWLLFSESSMFSFTSFGDCIRPQQQETTQKIQNILNEVYRIPQPPSTPEWMISWFTTKLLSLILSLWVAGYLHLSQRDLFCLDVISSSVSLSSTHTATPVTATYSTMISKEQSKYMLLVAYYCNGDCWQTSLRARNPG